jgi:hypothetical protein
MDKMDFINAITTLSANDDILNRRNFDAAMIYDIKIDDAFERLQELCLHHTIERDIAFDPIDFIFIIDNNGEPDYIAFYFSTDIPVILTQEECNQYRIMINPNAKGYLIQL